MRKEREGESEETESIERGREESRDRRVGRERREIWRG